MPASSRDTSGLRARKNSVTLPPIRDIFREQLSPEHARRGAGSSYSVGPMREALTSTERRPYLSIGASNGACTSTTDSHRDYSAYSYSTATGVPRPATPLSHGHSDGAGYRRPPTTPSNVPYHHSHSPRIGREHSRPPPSSGALWTQHRRRDSTDSVWSSHSGSSGASPPPMRTLPPPNSSLQFQPLPHGRLSPSFPEGAARRQPPGGAPNDYHSPFGVLIADVDQHSMPHSDPHRLAIMRTLKSSVGQSSFQIHFDDGRNALTSARYECSYCGKRFTRPSSLRIHNNSHTGEKPFECVHPGCGRRFSVQSNMRRHARVHEADETRRSGESSDDELAE